jgi:RIO kinase 1
VLMQYLGDDGGAAPRLAQARLGPTDLLRAWDQLLDATRSMTAAGWVHADLSAYNLLWWEDRLWVIDVPQAVELHTSTNGYDLLHRDVLNVCAWFASKGIPDAEDPDTIFGLIL